MPRSRSACRREADLARRRRASRDRVAPRDRRALPRRSIPTAARSQLGRRGRIRSTAAIALDRRRRGAPASRCARRFDTDVPALLGLARGCATLAAQSDAIGGRAGFRIEVDGDDEPEVVSTRAAPARAPARAREEGPLDPALQGSRRDESRPARRHHDGSGARARCCRCGSRTPIEADDVFTHADGRRRRAAPRLHREERAQRAEPGHLGRGRRDAAAGRADDARRRAGAAGRRRRLDPGRTSRTRSAPRSSTTRCPSSSAARCPTCATA